MQKKIALISSFALLASISIVKGGVFEWFSLAWGTTTLLLIASYVIFNKNALNDIALFFSYRVIIAFLCFQTWTVIQVLLPTSNDINASTNSALFGFSILGFLFILSTALKNPNNYIHLFNALIFLGLAHTIYGLFIFLSDNDKLLWMDKVFYLDRPTGFFVNPNHFAAYISLIIILLISQLVYSEKAVIKTNKIWQLLDRLFDPQYLIALILLITLLMTKSIGAIGAITIVLFTTITLNIVKKSFRKTTFIYAGGCAIAILFLLLSINIEIIQQESQLFSHTFQRRIALSFASWDMLKDHWVFGVGGGSFYSAFSQHRNLDIGNTYYNYAHNDYLQFWIEYGSIGIIILIGFIGFALRKNISILQKSNNSYQKAFAFTSLSGTAVLAIHSTVDFPLHIPGYCVLYLSILCANLFSDTDTTKKALNKRY